MHERSRVLDKPHAVLYAVKGGGDREFSLVARIGARRLRAAGSWIVQAGGDHADHPNLYAFDRPAGLMRVRRIDGRSGSVERGSSSGLVRRLLGHRVGVLDGDPGAFLFNHGDRDADLEDSLVVPGGDVRRVDPGGEPDRAGERYGPLSCWRRAARMVRIWPSTVTSMSFSGSRPGSSARTT